MPYIRRQGNLYSPLLQQQTSFWGAEQPHQNQDPPDAAQEEDSLLSLFAQERAQTGQCNEGRAMLGNCPLTVQRESDAAPGCHWVVPDGQTSNTLLPTAWLANFEPSYGTSSTTTACIDTDFLLRQEGIFAHERGFNGKFHGMATWKGHSVIVLMSSHAVLGKRWILVDNGEMRLVPSSELSDIQRFHH